MEYYLQRKSDSINSINQKAYKKGKKEGIWLVGKKTREKESFCHKLLWSGKNWKKIY